MIPQSHREGEVKKIMHLAGHKPFLLFTILSFAREGGGGLGVKWTRNGGIGLWMPNTSIEKHLFYKALHPTSKQCVLPG